MAIRDFAARFRHKFALETSQSVVMHRLGALKARLGFKARKHLKISATYSDARKKAKPGEGPKVTDAVSVTSVGKKALGTVTNAVMGEDTALAKAQAGESSATDAAGTIAKKGVFTGAKLYMAASAVASLMLVPFLNVITLCVMLAMAVVTTVKTVYESAAIALNTLTTSPEKREAAKILSQDRHSVLQSNGLDGDGKFVIQELKRREQKNPNPPMPQPPGMEM